MKLLFRIFLSLSLLLVHGFGATPVAARQLVLNKKVVEVKVHSGGVAFNYHEANEAPSIYEGEVEEGETDFFEDTEVEDENETVPPIKKYGCGGNYFADFYNLSAAMALRQPSTAFFDDTRYCQLSNDRYILFRVFRL